MAQVAEKQKVEFINLQIEKIYSQDCSDWGDSKHEGLKEGIYLCELPDGGQYFMLVDANGCRFGFWLPINMVIQNYIKDAKEQTIAEVLEYIGGIKAKLEAIESLANDNNIILNEYEDVAKENVQTIAQTLVNLEKQVKELPKQTEGQKSSLSEMAEAVVNIIKATK